MTFADDDELSEFAAGGHLLHGITGETVASALKGFALPLSPDEDMNWLAMAVRRALAISIRTVNDGPDRTSNADIRGELERLATLAGSTWLELFQCDHPADSRLWDHAWRHWDGEGGTDIGDGTIVGEPLDYRRFKAAVAELDWLSSFLRQAAGATESQRGPWRQSEQRRLRIERGQYLAPIFEVAFGETVTANNWSSDARHKSPTTFMDFYQRMVALAFGEAATSDLSGVLKAACQRHRQQPAQFGDGIIPGL